MKTAVTINEQGDLTLAEPDDTSMYIEVDESYGTALAKAPVGTPISIGNAEE